MDGENSYVERLDRLIGAYLDDQGAARLLEVVCALFEGICENRSVPCPVKMHPDEVTCEPMFLRKKDGMEHMVVFTETGGGDYPVVAELKLRGLMEALADLDKCEGVIFNPYGEHRFFVPKEVLLGGIAAGYAMALRHREEEEQEPEEPDEPEAGIRFSGNSVSVCRPVEEADFRLIERRVRGLTEYEDDFVIVDLEEDPDELLFIQTIRHGEMWYMELAFDMSDFDWEDPLILGAELDLEDAVLLFEQLLLYGVSPDDISMVQNRFRDIGFHHEKKEE